MHISPPHTPNSGRPRGWATSTQWVSFKEGVEVQGVIFLYSILAEQGVIYHTVYSRSIHRHSVTVTHDRKTAGPVCVGVCVFLIQCMHHDNVTIACLAAYSRSNSNGVWGGKHLTLRGCGGGYILLGLDSTTVRCSCRRVICVM